MTTSTPVTIYAATLTERIAGALAAEADAIHRAATASARAITHGAPLAVYDSGHIIAHELFNRAGGLAALTRVDLADKTPETAASELDPQSVLFLGSVSGTSAAVVELALQAAARGLTTVGISSREYSTQLESHHASGKRLLEVVDIAIDNHAPYGDAMLQPPLGERLIAPFSGISAASLMWAVVVETIWLLNEAGIEPTVFKSSNLPGGMELYEASLARYQELRH